jgi:UDP-N-acetylglucosamine acyltransferase
VATLIHPSAVVDKKAQLGENVSIGPFSIIEDNVIIGDGCTIGPHALVAWGTRMGRSCRIFNGAVVGTIPQDLKFRGEESTLELGDNVVVREFCTLNRGTAAAGKTVIGSGCVLLSYCHVGHDCILGEGIVASNNLGLAGHVVVGNNVGFGGYVLVHQFVRIGDHAFFAAATRIGRDVVPFAMCSGVEDARIVGINTVGLERRGFDEERRRKIKRAYRTLFREGLTVQDALIALAEGFPGDADVSAIIDFVKGSERGILRMETD